MNLNVEIDPQSGFCKGVVRAIRQAEDYLSSDTHLYSLGAIVHNDTEIARLQAKGLHIIGYDDLESMRDETVFIRAHGEPPSTYDTARRNNIRIMDCTCPVVLQLQRSVRRQHDKVVESGGQILIFGRKGHAEVNGLLGNVDGDAVIVERPEDVASVRLNAPVYLFSQTTSDPQQYCEVSQAVRSRVGDGLVVFDTICRQVATRREKLAAFAGRHDVIVFISGSDSSNGKVLFNLCREVNPRTYHIESEEGLRREWFAEGDSVGICGATSTPAWQLEKVASTLLSSY